LVLHVKPLLLPDVISISLAVIVKADAMLEETIKAAIIKLFIFIFIFLVMQPSYLLPDLWLSVSFSQKVWPYSLKLCKSTPASSK